MKQLSPYYIHGTGIELFVKVFAVQLKIKLESVIESKWSHGNIKPNYFLTRWVLII